jgi:alpha-D-xyloside xylohydrolase
VDFWTGETLTGGQTVTVAAPVETLPLYVKAGSIIPLGPFLQYATEKSADPIELRLYPGASGSFTLYEDENDNYDYEKGVHAGITFHWDDAQRRLTIEDRTGSFPGMLNQRRFDLVIVGSGHGTGVDLTAQPDKSIIYDGRGRVIQL